LPYSPLVVPFIIVYELCTMFSSVVTMCASLATSNTEEEYSLLEFGSRIN